MDGTFVEAPKQHHSREENAQMKQGTIPQRFTSDSPVGSHKDTDARWAKKNQETHYGYKNHVLADSDTKLILDYEVTDASVHDSIPCLDLMPPEPLYSGQEVHMDSAYVGSKHNPIFEDLTERGFDPQICEKGVRNHPLTPVQRFRN
jgi:IS5 family transposase